MAYFMSKKSWPILYSTLLYEMDQDFLDIQYITLYLGQEGKIFSLRSPHLPAGNQFHYIYFWRTQYVIVTEQKTAARKKTAAAKVAAAIREKKKAEKEKQVDDEEEAHTRKKGKEGKERPPRVGPQPKPGFLRQRQGDALNK